MKIGAQRLGDLLPKYRADRPAGDSMHHFTDEISLRQGVITGGTARLPQRRLRGEKRRHLLPVVKVFVLNRRFPCGKPGRVAHHLADLDLALAVLRELGPVLCDGRIEVEQSAIGQHERGQRRHRLGRRKDVDQGIARPALSARRVGVTAPQIDDRLAAQRGTERRTDVVALTIDIVICPSVNKQLIAAQRFPDLVCRTGITGGRGGRGGRGEFEVGQRLLAALDAAGRRLRRIGLLRQILGAAHRGALLFAVLGGQHVE